MNDLPSMERPNRYKRPARINLTDKDARLMRTRKGIMPSYPQAMVSPVAAEGVGGMLVTASDVVDEPNDTARLTQMAEQAEEITGVRVPMTLADAGYFAGKHVAELHHSPPQQVVMPDKALQRTIRTTKTSSYTMRRPSQLHLSSQTDPCLHRNKERPEEEPHLSSGFVGQSVEGVPLSEPVRRMGGTGAAWRSDYTTFAATSQHREWMATDEAKQLYGAGCR